MASTAYLCSSLWAVGRWTQWASRGGGGERRPLTCYFAGLQGYQAEVTRPWDPASSDELSIGSLTHACSPSSPQGQCWRIRLPECAVSDQCTVRTLHACCDVSRFESATPLYKAKQLLKLSSMRCQGSCQRIRIASVPICRISFIDIKGGSSLSLLLVLFSFFAVFSERLRDVAL